MPSTASISRSRPENASACSDRTARAKPPPPKSSKTSSRRGRWDMPRALGGQGRTVLTTAHYADEAERMCDRVAIVDHGRVIALGSPAELIARLGGEHLVEFALSDGQALAAAALQALPEVVSVRHEEEAYSLAVTAPHIAIPALLQLLQQQNLHLARVTTRHASFDDVFVTLTGRHLRDQETALA